MSANIVMSLVLVTILLLVTTGTSLSLTLDSNKEIWSFIPENIKSDPVIMAKIERELRQRDPANLEDRNSFLDWLLSLIGITTSTTAQPPTLTPPESCSPCQCGKTNTRIRIVGGQETEINEYPWMALLLYDNKFYCGGSLLNDRYVLTAAHCTRGLRSDRMSVQILEHDRSTPDETQIITRKVERVMAHARYSPLNYNNDIALLKLNETVEFKNLLRPICMPTPGKSFAGYDGTATGWGTTSEGGSVSQTLQEVVVPIMSNEECRMTSYGRERITDNMLCAGYPEGGKDSCQGDSGGPLQVKNDTTGLYQVVGITSWGEGCAKPDKPGVYTRVNRYITWLKTNTKDACYCSNS